MNETKRKVDAGSLVTGSILIGIGMLFLLDRFDYLHFGDVVRTWWPMALVIIGLPKLFRYETLWSGLWLLAVGAWLQAIQFELFGMTYGNSWPLLLIVLGGGMIARALADASMRRDGGAHGC